MHPKVNVHDPEVREKIASQWRDPPELKPGENIVVVDMRGGM